MTGVSAGNKAEEVGRKCGSCDLCCTIYPVPGITGKDDRCRFARSGTVTEMKVQVGEFGVDFAPSYHPQTGCGIYDKRPRMCRQFFCGWRLGLGEDDERPDKTGVVLDLVGSGHPDQAAVGVRLTFGPNEMFPDREAVLEYVGDVLERLKAGTLGAAHGWPAMKAVGEIGAVRVLGVYE